MCGSMSPVVDRSTGQDHQRPQAVIAGHQPSDRSKTQTGPGGPTEHTCFKQERTCLAVMHGVVSIAMAANRLFKTAPAV